MNSASRSRVLNHLIGFIFCKLSNRNDYNEVFHQMILSDHKIGNCSAISRPSILDSVSLGNSSSIFSAFSFASLSNLTNKVLRNILALSTILLHSSAY